MSKWYKNALRTKKFDIFDAKMKDLIEDAIIT